MRRVLVGGLLAATAAAGCAAARPLPAPVDPALARPVFVVEHGWHTRIAVRRADVPPGVWPESRAFGDAQYVEVGWGDRAFYPAPRPTVGMALAAVLWPTPAALHLAGLDGPPCRARAGLAVVRVDVTPAGLADLARFLHASHVRDADGRAIVIGPGQEPASAFYLATGDYHAFHTSNTWVLEALGAAGAPVTPTLAIFASQTMARARRVGRPACPEDPR